MPVVDPTSLVIHYFEFCQGVIGQGLQFLAYSLGCFYMSFQRILETARRMGSPLIVTDAAGREPMVVMTLQAFERLGEQKEQKVQMVAEVAPVSVPVIEKSEPSSLLQEIAIQVMENPEMAQDSEISMEERFYLEPVEEGAK